MQDNHQNSLIDEWQVAEGLYKCTKRMFDGTPEGKILFEVGNVYKCISKHDIAEFEVSYGHSVFLIDSIVRKHFIPLGKKDMSEEKIKTIDYKKAYEASLDRAKELWGIYKGERHIIEFILPEVCYLKDKEDRLKNMDNSRPKSINDNISYKKSEVICVNCSYRWLAERPVTKPLKDIECPWCGKQGFVIETGEAIKQLNRKRYERNNR